MPKDIPDEHREYLYRRAFAKALDNKMLRTHILTAAEKDNPREKLNEQHSAWREKVIEAELAGQAPFSRRTKEILSTGQPRLEGEDLSEWRAIVLAEDPASEKMALLAPDFLELHVKEQELSWAEIGTEAFVARWIASKGAHFLEID